MKISIAAPLTLMLALAGCSTGGSMNDYAIKSDVYIAAYDSRFAKEADRTGWSQAQQLSWSRGAAAEVCGLPFNREAYLEKLTHKFPEVGRVFHEMNGLQFHEQQIKKVGASFCTSARKADAAAEIASF